MFENYSDDAMQVVMKAHSLAREFRHSGVMPEHLFLAIVRDPESRAGRLLYELGFDQKLCYDFVKQYFVESVVLSVQLMPKTHAALTRAEIMPTWEGRKVEPDDLLYGVATDIGDLRAICEVREYALMTGIRAHFHMHKLGELGRQKSEGTSASTKDPSQWFNDASMQIVLAAETHARKRAREVVDVDCFLAAALEFPTRISDHVGTELVSRAKAVQEQTPGVEEIPLGASAIQLLGKAREVARFVGTKVIEPEHILTAILSLVKDRSVMLSDYDLDAAAAEVMHKKAVQLLRPQDALRLDTELPSISGTIIPASPRLLSVLKRTRALANGGDVLAAYYIKALFEEAQNSEVPFVENRIERINAAVATLEQMKNPPSLSMIELLEIAWQYAIRLGFQRLDINHIALALLDQAHDSITLAVNAVVEQGELRSRATLRRRLENCLMRQGTPGCGPTVEINITDLDSSLS
jgi:hypothetical protein